MSGEGHDDKLLQFPCDFPVKAMGRDADDFEGKVLTVFKRHLGDLDENRVSSRPSSSGKFLSVTVTVRAQNQEQLDALYRDLTELDEVLFCL